MNQIWVGSDWHLWNNNDNYAHPYRSDTNIHQFIDQIDTLPIQDDDLVLFLGDFADIIDPDPYKIQWILDKIPGHKVLIYGNHDIQDMSYWLTAGFDEVADAVKIHYMIFTHFPIHISEEYINFHGHLHTEKFTQLDARWVNVYNPDVPFTRLDDLLEKIRYNNNIASHSDVDIFPQGAKGVKTSLEDYSTILDFSEDFPLVPQDESVVVNQEDIYYNQEKFDSGEINLCFIAGHSGSGKTTMGERMRKKKNIEHYDMDDLIFIKDHFTLSNLKEYGDLIHSFFQGPGKKYYLTKTEAIDSYVSEADYEGKMFVEFVTYTKKYAKQYPKTKFVIEGVWLYVPKWFIPEDFKDYAFYIKGTSMIISRLRAAKRNATEYPSGKVDRTKMLKELTDKDRWAWYLRNEKCLRDYTNYFTRLMKQNPNMTESSDTLNEILFDDPEDTAYWEQDDEYQPGSREKELMAEDYEEVKVKPTHEPKANLKFLKEATEKDVQRLTNEESEEYDSPEVEDDAFGGEVVRFFNREESYPTSVIGESLTDEAHQILTLEDDARFMNEANTTKPTHKKLYPVYIHIFSNNTPFGKLIKTFTGTPYTHATIGLDSTMNNMYSFSGIPYNTAPLFLCSGFVRESIWSPAFTHCAFFHTYVTFVDKKGRDRIQQKIDNFIKNYDKYSYNTPGLFEYYFGMTNTKHHDERTKTMWFCSEFVAACIDASDEVQGLDNILQSPSDLTHVPNTFDLGEWHIEDFSQKKLDVLTKRAEAKFRKNPELSSSILSESASWGLNESVKNNFAELRKKSNDALQKTYDKVRQHDVHKYVFNLDWKKLHDEFIKLFPKNKPTVRFDLIGMILHSYLIPTKQPTENVTDIIIGQFKKIKQVISDGYIKLLDLVKSIIFFWNNKLKDSALQYPSEKIITEAARDWYYYNRYKPTEDRNLSLDPPDDYEGLSEAATVKLYPVYVLLSHRSASSLSRAIKSLTQSQFTHVAISFDPKLTHMYSFGRNTAESIKGSFRVESIKKDTYTEGDVPYALYVVPCTAEQCKLIKKRLKYFTANKSKFTFDIVGVFKNGLGIESEPDDKWFCSRFVADVLNAGAPKEAKYIEHPSLVSPEDFRYTTFAKYVCGGIISDYDYLIAERITKDILHSSADVRSQVGHLKNENINKLIPPYIKYHNQIWHYKYANDPEDINYPDA